MLPPLAPTDTLATLTLNPAMARVPPLTETLPLPKTVVLAPAANVPEVMAVPPL